MASHSISYIIAYLLLFFSITMAQSIYPSNGTDIGTAQTTPQFVVSQAGSYAFPDFRIAALGPYATIPRSQFITLMFEGQLVNIGPSNANLAKRQDFCYISCDPEDYVGSNLDASGVLNIVTSYRLENSVILYSRTGNHCVVPGINNLPTINGIFTTIDSVLAGQLADMNFTQSQNIYANIKADTGTYTNGTSGWGTSGIPYAPNPTTAIAMIVLYSITGVITALFVVIIVSGAVRAHRHPERYGPRNGAGRGHQSRAKGIARAMLETLPIVKFGDHKNEPKTGTAQDVELEAQSSSLAGTSHQINEKKDVAAISTATVATDITQAGESSSTANPDGSDESGSLGCSICTEDFQKGEELRVLPCNHKFHPICVDPWLLDVSGTCPLCRIDLRPQGSDGTTDLQDSGAPPLASESGSGHISMVQNLRAAVSGSREERIAALRRFRYERQRNSIAQNLTAIDSEQPGLARRLRERFRVRTGRHGTAEDDGGENRSTGT